MKKIILLGFISILSFPVFSAPEIKGNPEELKGFLYPNEKVVSIRGFAEKRAYSDKAIISLVVTTEDKKLSDALARNGQLRDKIESYLVSTGIDNKLINSSKFSSSPQYGWFGSKPESYKVVNRMAVSVTSESHLTEVAVIADRLEGVELSGTEFEHTKKDEFKEIVKSDALEKILKQKEFYEQSLGVKLVPIAINDSNIHQQATRGAMFVAEAARIESDSVSSMTKYREPVREPSFDEVNYTANISVEFKIISPGS